MKKVFIFGVFQLLLVVGVLFLPQASLGVYQDAAVNYLLRGWTLALYPLCFFSLVIAVCGLRRGRRLLPFSLRTVFYSLVFYFAALLLANFVEVLIPLGKLPFLQGEVDIPSSQFSWLALLDNLLAPTSFLPLREGMGFLLVVILLAVLLGLLLAHDREVSAPTYNLCDSLSRLAYQANRWLSNLVFIPLSLVTVFQLRKLNSFPFSTYPTPLLLLLLSSVLVFLLLPLVARLLKRNSRPYLQIYLNLKSLVVALVSGESALTLSSLIHDQHEHSGCSRKHSGFMTPLLFLFSRIGSAVMLAMAFAIVYASQNRWPMSIPEILFWRMLLPFLLALLLGFNNFTGLGASLVLLFSVYGEGVNYGYVMLLPLLPLIQRLAILLDTLGIVLINHLVKGHEN